MTCFTLGVSLVAKALIVLSTVLVCCTRYSDDDVAFLTSCIHMAMRLNHLFERIALINDRFQLSRLNKFKEEG